MLIKENTPSLNSKEGVEDVGIAARGEDGADGEVRLTTKLVHVKPSYVVTVLSSSKSSKLIVPRKTNVSLSLLLFLQQSKYSPSCKIIVVATVME
jgi:hypothetical protein